MCVPGCTSASTASPVGRVDSPSGRRRMSGAANFGSQSRRELPARMGLAGWGAAAGLVTGLPVGALMGYQGMLADRGIGAIPGRGPFILYATAAGAAIGLVVTYRPRGLRWLPPVAY